MLGAIHRMRNGFGRLAERDVRVSVRVKSREDDAIVLEPRMTGLVLIADPPNRQHLRFHLKLTGGAVADLWYWDRRGLGSVRLFTPEGLADEFGPHRLGPDALVRIAVGNPERRAEAANVADRGQERLSADHVDARQRIAIVEVRDTRLRPRHEGVNGPDGDGSVFDPESVGGWSADPLLLLSPLLIIVAVLLWGYSAPFAALCGIMSVVPTALLRRSSPQLVTDVLKAGDLVNHVAQQIGGKGGGRADMAQAGGTDASKLPQALESVRAWVEERV